MIVATETDLNKLYARKRQLHKTEYQTLQAVLKECRQQKLTAAILKGKGINTAVLKAEFKAISLKLSHRQRVIPQRPSSLATPTAMPIDRLVEKIVSQLLKEFDDYATIPEFRHRTYFLGTSAQNSHLYRLEREGKIDLSTLQETRFYRGQIDLGIPQPLIGEIPGPPLFFIKAAS